MNMGVGLFICILEGYQMLYHWFPLPKQPLITNYFLERIES